MGGVNSESSEHASPEGITLEQTCAQVCGNFWHVYFLWCGICMHLQSQFPGEMCGLFLWR